MHNIFKKSEAAEQSAAEVPHKEEKQSAIIDVEATQMGWYGNKRIMPGVKLKIPASKFSKVWMKKI